MKCEGGNICIKENGGHIGTVRPVNVRGKNFYNMLFNYCEYAISRDRKNGFEVEESDKEVGDGK